MALSYCPNPLLSPRRLAREVMIGKVGLGGKNPIRVQSMITCDTMDTVASIQQTLDLVAVGCEIVRITAPTVKDAANLKNIVAGLRGRGCEVPIVADIHFKPEAAMEAAKWVEKVRVNPGNYADTKKFAFKEYTDDQYAAELERIRERFAPLVKFCKEHGRAMRIGTNHGSLSDRIMNRYGDSPLGMVESALEFARIARELGYHDFVFSMKASNPKVMIEAYRLLVARLYELDACDAAAWNLGSKKEDLGSENQAAGAAIGDGGSELPKSYFLNPKSWSYPIHLGVTEAGDGEDGRIKSAIGIGSLLNDGIGDTIRVSLTEDSVHEIPVAKALVELISGRGSSDRHATPDVELSYDPFSYRRRETARIEVGGVALGGEETIRVFTSQEKWDALAHKLDKLGDYKPEIVFEKSGVIAVDPRDESAVARINASPGPALVTVADGLDFPLIAAYRLLAARLDARHPILLKDTFTPSRSANPDISHSSFVISHSDFLPTLLTAAKRIGSLLCDGIGDAVLVQGEEAPGQSLRLAYNILQAAGSRIFKTDYVACPSCGRTLFNLQTTTAKIKAATSHLKGVKIAIMGCIVNGPGEMADADFGYVGGAPGKINLYVGKTAVRFNIPEAEAVDRLQDLIREHGKWVDPAPAAADAADAAVVH
jgi:(E)-4-hydroxy-3-methylbut-2-enyl-diphosphate synthase